MKAAFLSEFTSMMIDSSSYSWAIECRYWYLRLQTVQLARVHFALLFVPEVRKLLLPHCT